MSRNHGGFTLIEMLITLSVVSLMILLPAISVRELYHQYRVSFFLTQFEKNMAFVQQAAIISGRTTTVHFHEKQCDFIYQWYQDQQKTDTVELPAEMESLVSVVSLDFKAGKGNVSNLPKFVFVDNWGGKKYEYQINLGSGKYEKKETEYP